MKVWKVYSKEDIRLEELPSQAVEEGCVKIKMTTVPISQSDIMYYSGERGFKEPIIIGRSGVGMVTEVADDVTNVVRGDRVFVESYDTCGVCASCKAGRVNDCEKLGMYGIDRDGFMRDFVVVPAAGIDKLPERIRDEDAIMLQHISAASNIVSKLSLQKGEHLVIVGANVLGIVLAQVAMYHQAVPILVDTRKENLEVASSLGIYYCINSVEDDVKKKILLLTGGRMSETLCYVTASTGSLSRSLELCAKSGRVAITGYETNQDDDFVSSFKAVLHNQLTVHGINNVAKNIATAINLLANGAVNVAPLITKTASFESVAGEIAQMANFPDKYIRIVIKI